MIGFWDAIDEQLAEVRTAATVDEVLAACPPVGGTSVGAGFFAGGGGDGQRIDALGAGWTVVRYEADYYWVARDREGGFLSYTEGDLDRGDNDRCGR